MTADESHRPQTFPWTPLLWIWGIIAGIVACEIGLYFYTTGVSSDFYLFQQATLGVAVFGGTGATAWILVIVAYDNFNTRKGRNRSVVMLLSGLMAAAPAWTFALAFEVLLGWLGWTPVAFAIFTAGLAAFCSGVVISLLNHKAREAKSAQQ